MNKVLFKKTLEEIDKLKRKLEDLFDEFWEWKKQLEQRIGFDKLSFYDIVSLAKEIRGRIFKYLNEISKKISELLDSKIDSGVREKIIKDVDRIKKEFNKELIKVSIFLRKVCGRKEK